MPSLDPALFGRVFRTTAWVGLLVALYVHQQFGARATAGFLLGTAVSLAAVITLEWGVRRYVRAGSRSLAPLTAITFIKLLVIAGVLTGAAFAARRGLLDLVWVLPGVMLPHLVGLLKVAGTWLVRAIGPPDASASDKRP